MSNIAIIPARGGSKRIPRKNIKDFLGKPIIAYSIEAALRSGLFDEVMVSTEDEEIATIAEQYGAKVPFLRSEKNADDFSGPGDVVFEVLEAYENLGKKFQVGCCILATSPLLKYENLKFGYDKLLNNSFDSIITVSKFSYPIWRSLSVEETGQIRFNFPEFITSRSQDLPNSFHDSGQFYFFKIPQFNVLENKNVFGLNKGCIEITESETQDIDTIEDWDLALLKAQFLIEKSNIK